MIQLKDILTKIWVISENETYFDFFFYSFYWHGLRLGKHFKPELGLMIPHISTLVYSKLH